MAAPAEFARPGLPGLATAGTPGKPAARRAARENLPQFFFTAESAETAEKHGRRLLCEMGNQELPRLTGRALPPAPRASIVLATGIAALRRGTSGMQPSGIPNAKSAKIGDFGFDTYLS
jgi:hypothetical protein